MENNNKTCPKTYLVESIITVLCCCWPFSIPAIISASKVESHFNAGNFEEAQKASDSAKKWTIVSVIAALVAWILYFLFFVLLGVAEGF